MQKENKRINRNIARNGEDDRGNRDIKTRRFRKEIGMTSDRSRRYAKDPTLTFREENTIFEKKKNVLNEISSRCDTEE